MERRLVGWMAAIVLVTLVMPSDGGAQEKKDWPQHDESRPQPPVVDPGPAPVRPTSPPSDAVVLFDGTSLSKWRTKKDGGAAAWRVVDGFMEVVKGAGDIQTEAAFGDCQLHVEWATPAPASGEGQHRGNSGVFLMGQYEVQVLDSYRAKTYPDGQAASMYGMFPPLVNASRAPGEWQSFDVVFRAPRFDAAGKVLRPARITVLHNGVLVHDNRELLGPTTHGRRAPYTAHAARLPLSLQDHDYPVRFRNIWIRELPEE
jgi:hypothetical protein